MKKMLFVIATLAMGFVVMPNVYAQYNGTDIKSETALNSAISTATDGSTIILDGDITANSIITINSNKNVIIDLNGYSISRTTGTTVFNIEESNVTFKDSVGTGKIEHGNNDYTIYVGASANVTIESGSYNRGFVVWGDKPTLNIKGGVVTTDGFVVSGNGAQTTDSEVNITGGTLTSTGTAAIYQPQTGKLNISGGNITGKIGVVARQGDINITGGNITATGEGENSVGDAKDASGNKVKLPFGTAVVVDNTESGYADDAQVTISGGNFSTTSANPVVSIGNVNTDIQVKAGATFNKTVNSMFLEEGLIQDVHGKVATKASLKPGIPTQSDTTTDQTEEGENTPNAPESEGTTGNSTTDVKNPNTADNFYGLVSMLTVSATGLFIAFKKVTLN